MTEPEKEYLGDCVYATQIGDMVKLTTEPLAVTGETNTIWLDRKVLANLWAYCERIMTKP